MAYEPKTWENGEIITADSLNHLEEGVANVEPGPQGPKGDPGEKDDTGATGAPGVGIKTITGSISGSNELTLTFTLTNDDVQTVTGTITPAV